MQKCIKKRLCLFNKYGKITNVKLDYLSKARENAKGRSAGAFWLSIFVDNQKADKPGDTFSEGAQVELRGTGLRYVSRGGLKLEKALEAFRLELDGLTCMDVGASTGGFTDCMLQNGAQKVYSVDVGYGQLAWALRRCRRG